MDRRMLPMCVFASASCATPTTPVQKSVDWPRYEYYEAKDGWRLRLKSASGNCIAESGQRFDDEGAVGAAIAVVRRGNDYKMIRRDSGCRS